MEEKEADAGVGGAGQEYAWSASDMGIATPTSSSSSLLSPASSVSLDGSTRLKRGVEVRKGSKFRVPHDSVCLLLPQEGCKKSSGQRKTAPTLFQNKYSLLLLNIISFLARKSFYISMKLHFLE